MLDADTKRRIDSARDILVGKVPDPKSQVEQITIALIYKFMDDMDRQSEELGGKTSFFSGEFQKYAWNKVMDPRLGGHERLNLYAEGIEKMNESKNIPQLFRDIFRGVFLPYRDPQTLHLFLKEIDGFSYDHSERLGDAYEYLLAVLGSQGNAGQFRTPRHIIDFIVAVVDPQKDETVLDPACGTAGFLISSFKHILGQNTKDRQGDQISADERGRLMTNFCGYDIAPDMVRLSRVNMYLHGFANPRIHEYDALTNEERWDERYDVILANPPFMTPKGGIRPHNRFAIKATRSEVLFVDYIAEHLNVTGRAGVIVPEGIIFQSQNAYKKLRTMLVESYLWCVVSLPAGCFNPYSGVKTSILLMDKSSAKRTDEILFVKVENDGFDLGAQRRPIDKNDLPEALEEIQTWRTGRKKVQGKPSHGVTRKRILESADRSLSGDRYRDNRMRISTKWPMVKLCDVCDLVGGGTPSKSVSRFWENGTIKWISARHISEQDSVIGWELITEKAVKESATTVIPAHAVVLVTRVSVGKIALLQEPIAVNQDLTGLVVRDPSQVSPSYLFWAIKGLVSQIVQAAQGLGVKGVTRQFMGNLQVPLPPLELQEKIVAELEGHRKVIEGAKQVIASYKPIIRIDPEWPVVSLGSVGAFKNGINYSRENKGAGIAVLGVRHFQDRLESPLEDLDEVNPHGVVTRENHLKDGDVLFVRSNGNKELVGRCFVVRTGNRIVTHSAFTIRLRLSQQKCHPVFYALLFKTPEYRELLTGRGANIANLTQDRLREVGVPLPPLTIQRQIVEEIEAERTLVEANRKLVEVFEKKIQTKLAEVWGEVSE